MASVSTFVFNSRIIRDDAVPFEVVPERVYGDVRVSAEWSGNRVTLTVTGELDRRDAPAYAELFFHDVFLLLNLSSPGSFGGAIAIEGGELRASTLTLSPRVFLYAAGLDRLPLNQVTSWYDGLQLGTQQLATSGVAAALFHLLHLARGEENDEQAIVRLAGAAEALLGRPESLARLFELREAIARGRSPVFHPMHDDALDPRVEDATREWIDTIDAAATAVIRALQALTFARPSTSPAPTR
jgi:ABC-type transporter Mla MlaB component